MPVVGADHEVIVARVLEHVRKIVIGLARHVDTVLEQYFALIDRGPAALHTPGKIMNGVGHPLRAYLDKSKLGLRESVRNLVKDQRMKRPDDGEFEFGKTALVQEKVVHREASRGRVHADRQIETPGFFVKRKKMGIAQPFVSFETAHEYAAG